MWHIAFSFLFFVNPRLRMLSPCLIHKVSLLRRWVILGITSSVHFSVIHMIGDPWRTDRADRSFILWLTWNPLLGGSSVPSSVSIVLLWNATLCFGITFCRCLGVPPVFYTSSRLSSGVSENLMSPYILLPVPPLTEVRLPPKLLRLLWVILMELLTLIMYMALLYLYYQVDCYMLQCIHLILSCVGLHCCWRLTSVVPCPVQPLIWLQ